MLELLLLRHAKSSWDQPGVGDHERTLAPRGEAAAPRMGELLAARGLVPDRVLCSTATRARHTWTLAATALPAAPEPVLLEELYLASPGRMLRLIAEQAGDSRRLLLVGHNPGMHTLAAGLARTGEAAARQSLAAKLPTAGLVHLGFDLPAWAGIAAAPGRLLGFWRPRDLDR